MNRGIVEWNEEYREWVEKKYTFIVCVSNVFRDHHWEDKSFLKEQFKELLDLGKAGNVHPVDRQAWITPDLSQVLHLSGGEVVKDRDPVAI